LEKTKKEKVTHYRGQITKGIVEKVQILFSNSSFRQKEKEMGENSREIKSP